MVVYDRFSFHLRLIKINKILLLSIGCFLLPASGYNDEVRNLSEKIADNFNHKQYYTTLNLCREVLQICESSPEPECWYTNIMKDIYRYKGISEFEIYKQELKKQRLDDAIESLTFSYNLFRDPEVQFLRGYLLSLQGILIKNKTDLKGLVIAWDSLLSLYARNSWQVSADIVDKVKLFIRVAEKFTEPVPKKEYRGNFAKFIIILACDLVERGDLHDKEKEYFKQIRVKYYREDGIQWQKWRSNTVIPP